MLQAQAQRLLPLASKYDLQLVLARCDQHLQSLPSDAAAGDDSEEGIAMSLLLVADRHSLPSTLASCVQGLKAGRAAQ